MEDIESLVEQDTVTLERKLGYMRSETCNKLLKQKKYYDEHGDGCSYNEQNRATIHGAIEKSMNLISTGRVAAYNHNDTYPIMDAINVK